MSDLLVRNRLRENGDIRAALRHGWDWRDLMTRMTVEESTEWLRSNSIFSGPPRPRWVFQLTDDRWFVVIDYGTTFTDRHYEVGVSPYLVYGNGVRDEWSDGAPWQFCDAEDIPPLLITAIDYYANQLTSKA